MNALQRAWCVRYWIALEWALPTTGTSTIYLHVLTTSMILTIICKSDTKVYEKQTDTFASLHSFCPSLFRQLFIHYIAIHSPFWSLFVCPSFLIKSENTLTCQRNIYANFTTQEKSVEKCEGKSCSWHEHDGIWV